MQIFSADRGFAKLLYAKNTNDHLRAYRACAEVGMCDRRPEYWSIILGALVAEVRRLKLKLAGIIAREKKI